MKKQKFEKYGWNKWGDLRKLENFVVLDIETTGLSSEKDRIIEIAMLRAVNGVVQDRYSSLVFSERPISSRITKLTGLTNEDLIDAPQFSAIAQDVADFINDSVIIAHNAIFDLSFIANAFSHCGIEMTFTYIDTLALSRKAYPNLKDHKLETLISELGLAERQTHRAMDDAECTFKLFIKIYQHYSTPLAEAISTCCYPMTDYQVSEVNLPLDGRHFALMGDLTFPYSAAKKLILTAGGIVDTKLSDDTDYLVYGYFDPIKYPPGDNPLVDEVRSLCVGSVRAKLINEVALLKMCGAIFYGLA